MANQVSAHLWNAAILVVSASVALAAERIATAPARSSAGIDAGGATDVADYVAPVVPDALFPRFQLTIRRDPFDATNRADDQADVASEQGVRTVPSSSASGSRLTAILIADDRRVAVIDDATVGVGDVLRDGARVAAIQPDRVFVVEKNGRWRTLTLTNRGQGGGGGGDR